jgi:uncharacterized membrane protein
MWVLLGIAIIVAGFMLRFNPLLVIVAAALATGLAAGLSPVAIVAAFGKAFNDTRYVSVVWIVLPVIGMLEAYGLRERARTLIDGCAAPRRAPAGGIPAAAPGDGGDRIDLGRRPSADRAAAGGPHGGGRRRSAGGRLSEAEREEIKAWAAATDNVGLFFGEDIFLAIGRSC